jgi:hypothetical protein
MSFVIAIYLVIGLIVTIVLFRLLDKEHEIFTGRDIWIICICAWPFILFTIMLGFFISKIKD